MGKHADKCAPKAELEAVVASGGYIVVDLRNPDPEVEVEKSLELAPLAEGPRAINLVFDRAAGTFPEIPDELLSALGKATPIITH